MKKRSRIVIPFCMIIFMMAALAGFAQASEVRGDVVYDGEKVNVNYAPVDFKKKLSTLMPGEKATLTIDVVNDSKDTTDWYVEEKVLKTFEEGSKATGGAYSYEVLYSDGNGANKVIYSSDKVGGENSQGLIEATNGSEEYFYLARLGAGKNGKFQIKVAIDGETVSNDYQTTMADINVNFGVSIADEKTNPESQSDDEGSATVDNNSGDPDKDSDKTKQDNGTAEKKDGTKGNSSKDNSSKDKTTANIENGSVTEGDNGIVKTTRSSGNDLRLNDLVKTGDHSKLMIYVLLFAVSAAALVAVALSWTNLKGGSNEKNS